MQLTCNRELVIYLRPHHTEQHDHVTGEEAVQQRRPLRASPLCSREQQDINAHQVRWVRFYHGEVPAVLGLAHWQSERGRLALSLLKFDSKNDDKRNLADVLGRRATCKKHQRIILKKRNKATVSKALYVLDNVPVLKIIVQFLKRPLLGISP